MATGTAAKPVKISESVLEKMLGPHKFRYGMIESDPVIGMTTGLAWTELGGELLNTEVTVLPGKGKNWKKMT